MQKSILSVSAKFSARDRHFSERFYQKCRYDYYEVSSVLQRGKKTSYFLTCPNLLIFRKYLISFELNNFLTKVTIQLSCELYIILWSKVIFRALLYVYKAGNVFLSSPDWANFTLRVARYVLRMYEQVLNTYPLLAYSSIQDEKPRSSG